MTESGGTEPSAEISRKLDNLIGRIDALANRIDTLAMRVDSLVGQVDAVRREIRRRPEAG